MTCFNILLLLCCIIAARGSHLDFPPGFKFGAATAAYQVEGAWDESDKSESVWDTFVHNHPHSIIDGTTGDVACDSYNHWREDIQIAKNLSLDFYRFSISWPRLLPTGFSNHISEDGKNYYNNLIDGLRENGIEVMVTLYHWDLPQSLQDLGGWTNPLMADWFSDYARVAYSLFGDRVKYWITLNEPFAFCSVGHGSGLIAPGLFSPYIGYYMCLKTTILAHAKAYRVYDQEFRHYGGKVSLASHVIWMESYYKNESSLGELAMEYGLGTYAHAIFSSEGGWPPVIEKHIAEHSKEEGLVHSRLPAFTPEEINLAKGTYDFFGVNHYTSRKVKAANPGYEFTGYEWPFLGIPELKLNFTVDPEWPKSASFWFYVYPEGLRKTLNWIHTHYNQPEIIVTENGYSDSDAGLCDEPRILYTRQNLNEVLKAIHIDGVIVTGYTHWSLMDNYEWIDGYTRKFGLYAVDFNSPNKTRTPRLSAKYYKSIIENRSLNITVPIDK